MPLYEYQCHACGERFEVIRKFSDPPADTCTKCGKGPVERLASSPAIQFKGTGWYITDYAKKSSSDASTGGKPASTSDDTKKSDGSKSESTSTDSTKSTTTPTTSTKE